MALTVSSLLKCIEANSRTCFWKETEFYENKFLEVLLYSRK
jgi:hypothetical protein